MGTTCQFSEVRSLHYECGRTRKDWRSNQHDVICNFFFFYRFGSQVEAGKMSGSKAKCIVARIRIYLSDGTEFTERPAHDKYGLRGSVNI